MSFDQEEEELIAPKATLKNVGSQKSMFENTVKKPSQEEFNSRVRESQTRSTANTREAAELGIQFKKAIEDKTLAQNKNVFSNELERELLSKMIKVANDINNDPDELREGLGSLSWIVLLLKTCLSQRDRINTLEYYILQLDKKFVSEDVINMKIKAALDKPNKNE
jgi:hypothetical protein